MTNVKKNVRACVCALLSLLMMLTMLSFPADVSALSLNKSSCTLTKGYGVTLKVSGAGSSKITWSSSDKTVATVSSSGKVVGRSVGEATIYASVSGKKLSCDVKVVGGKLALSAKSVTIDEGDAKYVTVRAKGSHAIKAVSGDKGIVTASWVKPWNGDDIRLKLTGKGAGSTSVKISLTKYPDVYTYIKVTVEGEEPAMLQTNQSFVSTNLDTPAYIIVYSNKNNSLNYSLSDSTVAKVTEGTWNNFYCQLTVTGLKTGSTNLTITRKDNPSIKKVIPITIINSGYYVVSDNPVTATKYTDSVYKWVDAKTGRYKYMLLPQNYDSATANTAIAKDAGKYEYYTVFDTSPTKQATTDTVQTFTVNQNGKSVNRYVLVPAKLDKPSANTAIAAYTGKFDYWTIYNISPDKYKIMPSDLVKTWTTTVNYQAVTRYMLVPERYNENLLEQMIAEDSGSYYGGYYSVSTTQPALKASGDTILSFYSYNNNVYQVYYVLVPDKYDEARYNDAVAAYNGHEYWKVYTTKPATKYTGDVVMNWTKIVDSKSVSRYILLPPGYDEAAFISIKNQDLETQTSSYYVVTSTYPTLINSKTDSVWMWYNNKSKSTKYMLLPENYDILKKNDIINKDTGTFEYYSIYSTQPTAKADGDQVLRSYYEGGVVYMLIPKDYDQAKVNQGMAGVEVGG